MRLLGIIFLSTLSFCAEGEEVVSITFLTGVTLAEKSAVSAQGNESLVLRKRRNFYDVHAEVFMPCQGDFSAPWLTHGPKATLVLGKERSAFGFRHNEECKYKVHVVIAGDRLERGNILYVVKDQVVVGHVNVL